MEHRQGSGRLAPASKRKAVRLPPGAYYALMIITILNVVNVWHRYLIYNLSAVSVEDCEECDDVAFVPLCYWSELSEEDDDDAATTLECLSCRQSYKTWFYNMKDGACIDTTQYGILAGVGFTLMFALATLFAGRLTDTLDRRLLHTAAILVWSLSCSAHGTCMNFSCLLVTRIFLGIGEAFNAPACYALITLYFPIAKRATANGIYSTGTYLGSAISSLCLAIAGYVGWRITAFFSGAVGVLCAALLFFTVEHYPAQVEDDACNQTSDPDSKTLTRLHDKGGFKYERLASHASSPTHRDYGGVAVAKGAAGMVSGEAPVPAHSNELSVRSGRATYSTLSSEQTGGTRAGGGAIGSNGTASGCYIGNGGASWSKGSGLESGNSATEKVPSGFPVSSRSLSSCSSSSSSGDPGNPFAVVDASASERLGNQGLGGKGGMGGDSSTSSPSSTNSAGSIPEDEEDEPLLGAMGRSNSVLRSIDNEELETSICCGSMRGKLQNGHDAGRGSRNRRKGHRGDKKDEGDGHGYMSAGSRGGAGDRGAAGEGGARSVGNVHDLRASLRLIMSNRIILVLFAASSARMVATWSMAGYMATYYKRAFPSYTSLYSILNAVFVSTGGMASSFLGGAISDRLRARDEGVLGYLPGIGSALAVAPMTVVFFSPSFPVSVIGLFFTYLVGECWLGPGMAVLQNELPNELAGTSVAILLFLNSVVCNLGPWFVAWQDPGTDEIRYPLYASIFVSLVSSFVLFGVVGIMVSRKWRRARRRQSASEGRGAYNHGEMVRAAAGARTSAGKILNYYWMDVQGSSPD